MRPVKRNHHSIKDSTNAPSAPAVAQSGKNMKDGIAPAVVAAAAPRESSPRKRTRLQFVDIAVLPLPESSDDNNNTMDNVDALASALSKSRSNSPLMRGSSSTNSNMNNASNYNSNLLSPNANSSSRIRKLDGSSNHSRDPNGKTTGLSKKSVQLAKISDFFLSSKPKSKVEHSSKDALDPTTEPVQEIATMSTATTQPATTMVKPTSQPNPQLPPHRPSAPKLKNRQPQKENLNSQELELLQRRFDELQQTCREKDEQLKAVSNNRTIFHSALQSTIRQREQELRELQESTEEHEFKLRYALEEMVRTEATQKARELREKLAADTVRLGRVVSLPTPPSRGPPRLMQHRAGIETWEEGSAPKEVELKRLKLKEKRLTMEQRLSSALEAEKRFVQKMSDKEKEGQPDSSEHAIVPSEEVENDIEVGGIIIQSELDVREAIESTRFHLDTIRQQEQALKLTEQTLNDEKGAHVRALRRVANEDASRFQMRPKLHDRYVLCSLLGKGGFSEVWRAYDLNELREVAVKIHELDAHWPESKKENYTKHVSREYEIHRDVRHPRIVTLYDVFEIDTNAFATVLEACDGTDLDTLLKVKRRLPEKDAKAILLQILSGMNYLSHPSADGSRQGVIHYDLKPGNILFDETGDAKITDFGLSKIVDAPDPNESMELTSQGAGTYWYLPPECFLTEGNVRISNKVDVWSIGVIFYQMLFGKRPFGDGQTQDKILADGTMLNAHTVTFPERIAITNGASEFLRACLTYDQSFRPSIAQICQHAYVISATTTGS